MSSSQIPPFRPPRVWEPENQPLFDKIQELRGWVPPPTEEMIHAGLREMFNRKRMPTDPWEDVISRIYRVMRAREGR